MQKPQLTRWSPNTCGCEVIEYTDENGHMRGVSHEEAIELHRQIYAQYPQSTKNPDSEPQRPPYVCAAHSVIPDHGELYDTMMDEGRRMCGVHRILLGLEDQKDLGLHQTKRVKNEDVVDFKDGVEYKWEFEGTGKNRTLKVRVVGASLTKNQKDSIKASCDQKHGAGRVEIL